MVNKKDKSKDSFIKAPLTPEGVKKIDPVKIMIRLKI